MNKQQLEALELLKGLSQKEILEGLNKLNDIKNKVRDEDKYWKLGDFGYADESIYNHTHDFQIDEFITLDCYRTEDEIGLYRKYCQTRKRIVNRIRKLNDGWKPDFENEEDVKFLIRYVHSIEGNGFNIDGYESIQFQPKDMYLKSKELAQQLIDEMSEDLRFYFEYENWGWLEV